MPIVANTLELLREDGSAGPVFWLSSSRASTHGTSRRAVRWCRCPDDSSTASVLYDHPLHDVRCGTHANSSPPGPDAPRPSGAGAEPDIVSATGEWSPASAARKLTDAVSRSSRNARAGRGRSYALWCATYDWAEEEPNAVLSYRSDLGDRGHPANSI